MGKRGPAPKKQVATEWSSVFAYALGLLASDGSLSKDGRHFDFTSKDKDQVITFQRSLGLKNVKIGGKYSNSSGSKKYYYRIQFGDVHFYQWCLECGFTPNKSRTIRELKIPDKYFFDFLRGCFDGDGTVYAYWDKRWRSSYMFYLSFTSGSKDFLYWLQNTTIRLLEVKGHITTDRRQTYQLKYAKKEAYIIFDQMYHSKGIFYLKRKFAKAQKIFMIDKENKKR
jgi:hypothetical protein